MAKKGKKKERILQRVLRRDRGLCGVHLLGCGQPVVNPTDDHIVPLSLIKASELDFPRSAKMLKGFDSNRQPMCRACNQAKREKVARAGANGGWPNFSCKCHALQIRTDDVVVLLTRQFPHPNAASIEPTNVIEDQRGRLWLVTPILGMRPVYHGLQRVTVGYNDGSRQARLAVWRQAEKEVMRLPLSGDEGHAFVNFGETPPGWAEVNRLWAGRVGIFAWSPLAPSDLETDFYGWYTEKRYACVVDGCSELRVAWSNGLCLGCLDEVRKLTVAA